MIGLEEAAAFLQGREKVLILCHQYPDGDTLGSGAALCRALRKLGRRAQVRCSDPVGPKYRFLFSGLEEDDFEPDAVVAVDIADKALLGEPLLSRCGGGIDLSIDHHPSNSQYAARNYVDKTAAATCEIIFQLIGLLGVRVDAAIAEDLYTGVTTDTGCFRYSNVTPRTYRIAADLVETGIDAPRINREMFDTKSRARMEMERRVLDSIEYDCGGRIALIRITNEMIAESGAKEDDLDGLASIPREIEGVVIGVTLREKDDGAWKVSLRAHQPADASEICARFGGGGHKGAAGCTLRMPYGEARERMLEAVRESLKEHA